MTLGDHRPMSRSASMTRRPLAAAFVATLTAATAPADAAATGQPAFAARVPVTTTQVVRTVRTHRWCDQVWCTKTQAWEKVGDSWQLATLADGRVAVFRSTIGPRGFAAPGAKRQNDDRSPTGVYRIKTTFSTTTSNP